MDRKLFKRKIKLISMAKKGKKISGGKYKKNRKRRFYEIKGQRRLVKLGEEKKKSRRTRGKNKKVFLLKAKFINVQMKGKNKNKRLEIKNVLETPSNKFLARQNVLTKGAIVETDAGKVRITNRPSHEGVLNGVLVE